MSFSTSLSGLKGAQTDLGTISNNIANVGTFGFKKSRASSATSSPRRAARRPGHAPEEIEQQFSQGGFEASRRRPTSRSRATASS